MTVKDAVATVLNRNAFYRDGYRMMLRISLVLGAVIAVLVLCIVTLILNQENRPVYFATTMDGRIIELVPINTPYRSNAEVTNWAARVASNVFHFSYSDYREKLQEASNSFTLSGWESFTKGLKDSQLLDAVTARKLTVTLAVNAAPEIGDAGVRSGVFTWCLVMPVTLKYDGNDPLPSITQDLVMKVVRVSTLQSTDGIGVEQWNLFRQGEGKCPRATQ